MTQKSEKLLDDNDRAEGPLRSKMTDPKDYYVQKGQDRSGIMFKNDY
jgi:hypothetical protein